MMKKTLSFNHETQDHHYVIDSCLDGQLEKQGHDDLDAKWLLRDTVTGAAIPCCFPKSMTDELSHAVGERVRLYGPAKYSQQTQKPLSIDVEHFEIIGQNKTPPSLSDLHSANIDITQGLSSETFIRKLRDEE